MAPWLVLVNRRKMPRYQLDYSKKQSLILAEYSFLETALKIGLLNSRILHTESSMEPYQLPDDSPRFGRHCLPPLLFLAVFWASIIFLIYKFT